MRFFSILFAVTFDRFISTKIVHPYTLKLKVLTDWVFSGAWIDQAPRTFCLFFVVHVASL